MRRVELARWHSINLVPCLSAVSICSGGGRGPSFERHRVVGWMVELTWLGRVLRIVFPDRRARRYWTTGVRGPVWSGRRRTWYWSRGLPGRPRLLHRHTQ